jgi:PPOX class probable F420-dependent enzyme
VDDVDGFAALARERHISLTTFKRDGSTASTPVWVVSDDARRLLVWSGANTWKVKRIRNDPRVRVAPCDSKGRVHGDAVDGTARLLGPEAASLVQPLLREKYGFVKRALDVLNACLRVVARRPKPDAEYIEILPAPR